MDKSCGLMVGLSVLSQWVTFIFFVVSVFLHLAAIY